MLLIHREKAEVRREERRRKRDAEEAAAKAAKDKEKDRKEGAKSSGESAPCLHVLDLPLPVEGCWVVSNSCPTWTLSASAPLHS